MNRITVIANALKIGSIVRTTWNAGELHRAYRGAADAHTAALVEAGSNDGIAQVLTTATDEEKAQAQQLLGWTPNPQNVATLLQIVQEVLAMLSTAKTPPAGE
jgi:hypothetical protein